MLYLHPRDEQRFRDAKLPTAGLIRMRGKTCGNTRYSIQGRKKLAGGGWRCAECAK